MQLGLENKKLPDSALTASASQTRYPAHEARIQTGKGWCLPRNAKKDSHLQIDMGKVGCLTCFCLFEYIYNNIVNLLFSVQLRSDGNLKVEK